MGIQELISLSQKYGKNPEFVLAGGGNTSYKDGKHLWIKASGFPLADIGEGGFAKMDEDKLAAIWKKDYPADPDAREEQALADLMDARSKGETKRPSVETLLHDLFPQAYVVHLHPPLVNGLTCSMRGKEAAEELFPEGFAWIPVVNPGYVLANEVKKAVDDYTARGSGAPSMVFLQNHGVFVAADTADEIDRLYNRIMSRLGTAVSRRPDFSPVTVDGARVAELQEYLQDLLDVPACGFEAGAEILRLLEDETSFAPVSSSLTPDHIVYYGDRPLLVGNAEDLDRQKGLIAEALRSYRQGRETDPRIVAIMGLGVFAVGKTPKVVDTALILFKDAVKISVYAEAFGGVRFMPQDKIDFIVDWEVEQYRSKVNEEK
jgi:rhamnose utilization protein RhaD (predicted bifunctional aldolase and dehydrogenase)